MADDPDGGLLVRFVQGDREAFEVLFTPVPCRGPSLERAGLSVTRARPTTWSSRRSGGRSGDGRGSIRPAASVPGCGALQPMRRAISCGLRGGTPSRPSGDRPTSGQTPAPDRGVAEAVGPWRLRRLPPRLQVVATLALIEERPLHGNCRRARRYLRFFLCVARFCGEKFVQSLPKIFKLDYQIVGLYQQS